MDLNPLPLFERTVDNRIISRKGERDAATSSSNVSCVNLFSLSLLLFDMEDMFDMEEEEEEEEEEEDAEEVVSELSEIFVVLDVIGTELCVFNALKKSAVSLPCKPNNRVNIGVPLASCLNKVQGGIKPDLP
jgi:hypothetical protein